MDFLTYLLCIYSVIHIVKSDPINYNIKIDGNFDDWADVKSYTDPEDKANDTVFDQSPWYPSIQFPDCHDVDTSNISAVPKHIYNPNVDIVEFKIAHDDTSIYVYYRVADGGVIGKTSVGPDGFDDKNSSKPSAGRFYIIATVDLDMNETTGYWLHGGGYHPTAPGFDANFEVEFYNGTFNQDYYLDHAANNQIEANYSKEENKNNSFIFLPAIYDYYTQYIYWKEKPTVGETKRCQDGPHELPHPYSDNYICFTADKAAGPFDGIISYARSEKGNEFEMRAPFQGLLINKATNLATLQLGMTINISLSLETTPEYSTPHEWVSDTGATVRYTLSASTSAGAALPLLYSLVFLSFSFLFFCA